MGAFAFRLWHFSSKRICETHCVVTRGEPRSFTLFPLFLPVLPCQYTPFQHHTGNPAVGGAQHTWMALSELFTGCSTSSSCWFKRINWFVSCYLAAERYWGTSSGRRFQYESSCIDSPLWTSHFQHYILTELFPIQRKKINQIVILKLHCVTSDLFRLFICIFLLLMTQHIKQK